MRHSRRKWIIGGATAVAAAAIAAGAAVPALAQQSGGQHHRSQTSCGITLVPTGGSPDLSTVIPATPQPLSAVPTVCGQSGTTQAAPGAASPVG